MEGRGGLKKDMAIGIKWSALSQIVQLAFQFVFIAVLARLLFPEDFGLMAIVMIFVEIGLVLKDAGLGVVIVQRKKVEESHLSASFLICVMAGLFLSATLFFTAPLIAGFFNKGILSALMRVLSVKFILYSLCVVQESILVRKLFFKKLAFVTAGEAFFYGTTAIAMAVNGFGVWSLVFGQLAGSFVRAAMLWYICKWRPVLRFDATAFREIFSFAKNFMGFKIVNYLNANLDRFLTGRFLGAGQLGFYSMAHTLITFPQQKISGIVNIVGFPSFSKIQDNREAMKAGYLKIVSYVSAIAFPLLMGLLAVTGLFINVVYSGKWLQMEIPLRILCVAGTLFSINTLGGIIILSIGRPDMLFKLSGAGIMVRACAVLVGIRYGLTGVAFAMVFYGVIMNIMTQRIIERLIRLSSRDYLRILIPPLAASVIMAFCIRVFLRFQVYFAPVPDIAALIISIFLGAAVYLGTLFLIKAALVKDMLRVAREMF